MKIILNPPEESKQNTLRTIYQTAVKEAKELFIINAYLTDWSMRDKLNPNCENFCFIVGTDFGITRKDACKAVLKWLPKNLKDNFLAVDKIGGFHPKLVIWKDFHDRVFLLLGSSNLTDAAFNTNYEANIFTEINLDLYSQINQWVDAFRENASPISEDWLDHQYVEATRGKHIGKRKKQEPKVYPLPLPGGKGVEEGIRKRRQAQKTFLEIKDKLLEIVKQSASGKMNDLMFYEEMMKLWSNHPSRFQGSGFQILGKHAKWHEICVSLLNILNKSIAASQSSLDDIVKKEIDNLVEKDNPLRRSWLSEMLCHFFPEKYPLIDEPVQTWLKCNKYRAPRNSSEGAKYIDLAIKMRQAIKGVGAKSKIKDLPELDTAIWKWNKNRKGKSF
jgi:hypothetical protein